MINQEPVLPTLQLQERFLKAKRENKSLEKHFKFFNDFLKLKHSSSTKTYIFLFFAFIEQFLTILRQQLQYQKRYKLLIENFYDGETTIIDSILSAAIYIDIQGLLRINSLISYMIFLFCLFWICLSSFLYFLMIILGSDFKPRKKFIGQLFVFLAEYYIWPLHYPMMITFFEFMNGSSVLGFQVDSVRMIMIVLAGIGQFEYIFSVAFGTVNVIVFSLLFQNNQDEKKDWFNSENTIFLAIYQTLLTLVALFASIKVLSEAYIWVYLLLLAAFYLGLMLSVAFGSGQLAFATLQIRRLFLFFVTFMSAEVLAMLIDQIYRQSSPIEENVSLFFVLCFIFLQCCLWYNLENVKTLFVEFDILKLNGTQLQKQIFILQSMLEQSNSDNHIDTFYKGIIQRHFEFQCQHNVISGEGKCFCHKKTIYDPKKKKEVQVEKWIFNKSIFIKFLIKSWYETFLQRHPQHHQIQIYYARFLFSKMRNHCIALEILLNLDKQFTFILDRYQVFQLKQSIIKYVKHLNTDSYKGKLEIETALFVEEQIESIKDNITQILKQNCAFWGLLQQQTIDLEEIDDLLRSQFGLINDTKQLWITITSYLDYKKKWKFYYAWFYLYILNKKIKNRILDNFQGLQVNENDIFSEEIQENNLDDDVASVKTGIMQIDVDKIIIKAKKIVFDKKACIIQTNDDPNAMILKINKQFTKIFGYKREDVVGLMNINALMPEIMQKVHPEIMQDYKLTGKSSSLYSQRKVYCIHKNGYMFTCWKFIKIYIDIYGNSQFVVMLRPTDYNNEKKHDYILFNQDWEVNGMTQNVIQSFQLDKAITQKSSITLVNLLLFAPKLIQYSRIARYLQENDLVKFGMVRTSKKEGPINPSQSKEEQPSININKQSMHMHNQLSIGKESLKQVVYSEIENSKNYIPLSSMEPAEDTKFVQQLSHVSSKNDFQEFQNQMQQMENINGLAVEMQQKANNVIKQQINEQYRTNLIKIQTQRSGQESESESDNNSHGDQMDLAVIKKASKNRAIEEKIEHGEVIVFHLKLASQYVQAVQHYSAQKQKISQIKAVEDEIVKQKENFDNVKQNQQAKKSEQLIRQATLQKEIRKKARLMFAKAAKKQLDDEERKFYDLILNIYEKYLQDSRAKKFKVTCTIKFAKIKSERIGLMKIIGIQEVQRVKRRGAGGHQAGSFLGAQFQLPKINSKMMEFQKMGSIVALNEQNKKDLNQKYVSMNSENADSKQLSAANIKPSNSSSDHAIPLVTPSPRSKQNKLFGMGYQLKDNDDIEDDKELLLDRNDNKMIDWESFQHQFKMQQGAQSFSLNVIENIFRKEDNNKARKFLIKIAYLTWFLRFMFLAIIALSIFTYFYKPYSQFNPLISYSNKILQLSQMQTYILEAYDTSLDLIIYQNADYTKLYLLGQPIGTQQAFYTWQLNQIDSGYQFIIDQINNTDQQSTFVDSSLMSSSSILDKTISGSVNVDQLLDQKDFFAKLIMVEHQISLMNTSQLQNFSVNDPNSRYIRFITMPYVYNLMNNAVSGLQSRLTDSISSMNSFIYIILILEGCVYLIGFIGLLIIIIWICQTYKAVLRLFIMIKKNDLAKIIKQQRFIQTQFKYLINKDDEINGVLAHGAYSRMNSIQSKQNFQQANFLLINEEEELNVNKKRERNILEKKLLKALTLKLSFAYILLVLLAAGASLAFFLTLSSGSNQIGSLVSSASYVITQFADSQLLLVSLKERYIDEANYKSNYLPKMQNVLLTEINAAKSIPIITDSGYGSFFSSYQQVFYTNLCTYLASNSTFSSSQLNDCSTLCENKLAAGLIAFYQYYISNIQDQILNNQARFGQTSQQQIWTYNSAIDYVKSAYKMLIATWADDLSNLVNSNFTLALILFIIMLVFQLFCFFLIAELYLVSQLNTTFSYYRQVYKNYLPNDIIQKEKIIKAQLVRYNIIKK